MTDSFKKFDEEKLDLTFTPPSVSRQFAAVAAFGAKKYGRNNWRTAKIEDVGRYYAAMLRHQASELEGDFIDPESHLPHGWHAAWNRAVINFFIEKYGHGPVFKHIIGE